jgi:H+-translocating diphosphatase
MRFQVIMSVIIFVLLGSENNFSTQWHTESLGKAAHHEHKGGSGSHEGNAITPSLYNGLFSTISFLLGATTSILSGYLGMKIATYANARVTVQARKGIAPAFEAGVSSVHLQHNAWAFWLPWCLTFQVLTLQLHRRG